jgi:hypothetical protein
MDRPQVVDQIGDENEKARFKVACRSGLHTALAAFVVPGGTRPQAGSNRRPQIIRRAQDTVKMAANGLDPICHAVT